MSQNKLLALLLDDYLKEEACMKYINAKDILPNALVNTAHQRLSRLPKYDSAGAFALRHLIIVLVWRQQRSFPTWGAGMKFHNPRSQPFEMSGRIPLR